jgi:hypothetical protein
LNPEVGGFAVSSEHPIATQNIRGEIDAETLTLQKERMFECKHALVSNLESRVVGMEDCRLFVYREKVWFLATTMEFSEHLCEMILGHEDGAIRLKSPDMQRHQKNWCPFEHGGKLLMIYQFSPLQILDVNTDTGDYKMHVSHNTRYDLSPFRGSAGPVLWRGDYYLVVHEVIGHPRRTYFHRFVQMSSDLHIVRLSLPFVLKGDNPVEYVSGIAILNDIAYISWGDADTRAMISSCKMSELQKQLVIDVADD